MSTDLLNPTDPETTLPPEAGLFRSRAARFEQLAVNHPLGPWLAFLGQLSLAQEQLNVPLAPAPADHPPCWPAQADTLPADWITALHALGAWVADHAPDPVRAAIAQLASAPPAELTALATRVLADARGHGEQPTGQDAAARLLVAATLQACWTRWARQAPAPLPAGGSHCPCCGSAPVASVIQVGARLGKLRYLHCALCNTRWYAVRARCTACDSDGKVHYQQLEGGPAGIHAETCDACQSYLKILFLEQDPALDPVADDLASLALDVALGQANHPRNGPNLFLLGTDEA